MGKSLQKALLVSLVAFAGGVQGAMAESKVARTPEQRCDIMCADLVTKITLAAGENPSGTPTASLQQVINDLSSFVGACKRLCGGGVFTVEALMSAMGMPGANSFVSAPAAKTSPSSSIQPPPPPPPNSPANKKTVIEPQFRR
jgi:hypothetical protein